MAAKKRIVVAGSRGVFGRHLLEALGDAYDVVATTRETLDLRDAEAVARAARGAFAFACAAGPFQQLDRAIVRAVVNEGTHWLDISDDERWFFALLDDRELDALARARGVVVMPGLSTLPALSSALVRRLVEDRQSCLSGQAIPPVVHITLYIGNANAKGAAAVASAADLRTPDRELLRRELGADAHVHTRFQMPGVNLVMRALRILPLAARVPLAKLLARLAPRFGSSGGWLQVNDTRIAINQNAAILPLVFALERLEGRGGCLSPMVLDPEELLRFVE